MDACQKDCDVASAAWQSWHHIPWSDAHRVVARIQTRIAKAANAGQWRKARSLQKLLIRPTSAKAMAVKRVTENQGRRTPGVDNETWGSPEKNGKVSRSFATRATDLRRYVAYTSPKQMAENVLWAFLPCAIGRCRRCICWRLTL